MAAKVIQALYNPNYLGFDYIVVNMTEKQKAELKTQLERAEKE